MGPDPSATTRDVPVREASGQLIQTLRHTAPPKLADGRTGPNDRVAGFIAKTVGSMWMLYASVAGFTVWMADLGATVAGDRYPFNLMLLAVGGIMQWLAMIAILVAQNAQGNVQDKQVEHLHDLGMTTPPSRCREHRVDEGHPRPLDCGRHGTPRTPQR